MSQYIMSPGSRLLVGPDGRPYQALGRCCPRPPSLGSTAGAGISLGLIALGVVGFVLIVPRVFQNLQR